MVADAFIEFGACLHGGDDVALCAVAPHRFENVLRGLVRGAESGEGIKRNGDTDRAQFIDGEKRRCTEFRDVGEHGYANGLDEFCVHCQIGHGFWENHVSAGFDAGDGTSDRCVQPFDRQRIGAGHDDELRVGPGVDGGLDAVDHFAATDDFLVRPMAAALGADLILDMHAGSAHLDHRSCGARDVEGRGAKAGIDIDEQWQVTDIGNAAHIGGNVVKRRNPEVGQAQRPGSDAAARQIDGAESGALGEQGMVRIDGAGDLQWRFFGDGLAQYRAGRVLGHDRNAPVGGG